VSVSRPVRCTRLSRSSPTLAMADMTASPHMRPKAD
jgi:hypothetical protein